MPVVVTTRETNGDVDEVLEFHKFLRYLRKR